MEVYSILCGRKRQKMALFLLRSVYLEVFGVAIDYVKKFALSKEKNTGTSCTNTQKPIKQDTT